MLKKEVFFDAIRCRYQFFVYLCHKIIDIWQVREH